MKMIRNFVLVVCFGLAFTPQRVPGQVLGDATNLTEAVFLATNNVYPNKTILLVVSDTNTCSACRALESTGLPNPAVLNLLHESFVYWPSGPDQHTTGYQQWLGSGQIPVPQFLLIDPANTRTYFATAVGFGGASVLWNELIYDLLAGTAPYVTSLKDTNSPGNTLDITAANWKSATVSFSNITVECSSISTNIALNWVNYTLDPTNGWSRLTISNRVAWAMPLNPAQIVVGTNVLRFYATDQNVNKTRTNVFTFIYNPNAVVQNPTTTTTTLSPSANPTTYGSSVTLTATVTPQAATGGVVIFNDGAVLSTNNLNNGTATYTTSQLSAGSHSLSAVYGGNSSYSGSAGAANLTVSPASLTITADPTNKFYGQTVTFGSGSKQFTNTGLQNGETIDSVTLACSGGVATAPVSGSPYTITPSAATGGTFNPANYSITYNPGTLTVVLPGDLNGDGIVDQAELNAALASFWATASSRPYMMNPAKLSGNVFQFELTNAGEFTMQFSTDLVNWTNLPGPAYPVYQFIDAGATNSPRFYRVVQP